MNTNDLIKETIEYYRTHPMSWGEVLSGRYNKPAAYYYHPTTGAMCAVGRCLVNPKKVQEQYGECWIDNVMVTLIEFKPQYVDIPAQDWVLLQELHDCKSNWVPNDQGGFDLSKTGIDFLNNMFPTFELH